jgi:hypothetical protein
MGVRGIGQSFVYIDAQANFALEVLFGSVFVQPGLVQPRQNVLEPLLMVSVTASSSVHLAVRCAFRSSWILAPSRLSPNFVRSWNHHSSGTKEKASPTFGSSTNGLDAASSSQKHEVPICDTSSCVSSTIRIKYEDSRGRRFS